MLFINILLFAIACVILWKASQLVIRGVDVFAHSIRISSFTVSFLILGILTSLTEISVGLNALLDKTPEIFVGNLIGGSFVIIALIIPVLAIFNRGITLKDHLSPKKLLFFLILIGSPSLVILDGEVGTYDAWLLLLIYVLFVYMFEKSEHAFDRVSLKRIENKRVLHNLLGIVFGAGLIYFAAMILVDKTIYFADIIGIPSFLISLLILSIGTNLPELVIAANSIKSRKSDIAFGDYIGSAAANTMLFGVFTLMSGPFSVAAGGFSLTFLVILAGYAIFFVAARSKNRISAGEGLMLLLVYIIFISLQASEIVLLSKVV